jgi:hypothetical protein
MTALLSQLAHAQRRSVAVPDANIGAAQLKDFA